MLFIDRMNQPISTVEEGLHLTHYFYLPQKPKIIIFDLLDRKITTTVTITKKEKSTKEDQILISAKLDIYYRLTKDTDLAKVYNDFGDTADKIDQGVISKLKMAAGEELGNCLKEILSDHLNPNQIHSLLLNAFKKKMSSYKIHIGDLNIINQKLK